MKQLPATEPRPLPQVPLQLASGDTMPIIDCVSTEVWLPGMNKDIIRTFIVVKDLIAPGVAFFFRQHKLTVDFSKGSVQIYSVLHSILSDDLQHIWQAVVKHKPIIDYVAVTLDALDITTDCEIPNYGAEKSLTSPSVRQLSCFKLPGSFLYDSWSQFISISLFPTQCPPIRVPPRRVPARYRTEVERQVQQMLEQGVITESSSPWMALAPKKSGELHICIDYCQLNKQTVKDAYPLPLPDEV